MIGVHPLEPTLRRPEPHLGGLESAFRASHLAEEIRAAQLLVAAMIALALTTALTARVPPGLDGGPEIGQTLRLLLAALGTGVAALLPRLRTPGAVDRTLMLWSTATALQLCFSLFRGAEGLAAPVFFVVASLVLLPMPLHWRLIPGILPALAAVPAVFDDTRAMASGFAPLAIATFAFATLLGAWSSVRLNTARRAEFLAHHRERRALHDVETLEGLLPVCSGCGRTRDDEGFWTSVYDYMGRTTHYVPTHGICPPCHEEQLALLEDLGDTDETIRLG